MQGKRLNQKESKEAVILYRQGLTTRQIGKIIGISATSVRKRLLRANEPRRPSNIGILQYKTPKRRVEFICQWCNNTLFLQPKRAREQKFCSPECAAKAKGKATKGTRYKTYPIRTCPNCDTTFEPLYPSQKRTFCTIACARHFRHINHLGPSTIERIIGALLVGMDIQFEREFRLGNYRADFFLPTFGWAIECDGDYWHKLPCRIQRAFKKERAFVDANIPVLHLSETEINANIEQCKQRILSAINTPKLPLFLILQPK